MPVNKEVEKRMIEVAKKAASRTYSPYSNFPVGAALLMGDGSIVAGCNVENASFGLTNCAERTAVFTAIAQGNNSGVVAVMIYTPTPKATSPCGACRQVLNQFGPRATVIGVCDSDDRIDTTVDELLPGAFGPKNLEK